MRHWWLECSRERVFDSTMRLKPVTFTPKQDQHTIPQAIFCHCHGGNKGQAPDADMPSVTYKATVKDAAGTERDFELPVPLKDEEFTLLNMDTPTVEHMKAVQPVVAKISMEARQCILSAEKWTCQCGRPAAHIADAPTVMVAENQSDPKYILAYPLIFCSLDGPCEASAIRRMIEKSMQVEKEETERGIINRRGQFCVFCEAFGQEVNRCSRCQAQFYCSRACQVAHWKAGHKKECSPP